MSSLIAGEDYLNPGQVLGDVGENDILVQVACIGGVGIAKAVGN